MGGSGFFGMIKKIFSGNKGSVSKDKSCCCHGHGCSQGDSDDKTYKCQICGRMIHEKHSIEHIKAEEYLIELIRKDHSHWKNKKPTCQECVEYYRKLVKNNEI